MNIGDYLKAYRSKNKILQKQMADILGISREHYAQIERGYLLPSSKILATISERLPININISFKKGKNIFSCNTKKNTVSFNKFGRNF